MRLELPDNPNGRGSQNAEYLPQKADDLTIAAE